MSSLIRLDLLEFEATLDRELSVCYTYLLIVHFVVIYRGTPGGRSSLLASSGKMRTSLHYICEGGGAGATPMLSSNYNYAYKPHTIMKLSYEENRVSCIYP